MRFPLHSLWSNRRDAALHGPGFRPPTVTQIGTLNGNSLQIARRLPALARQLPPQQPLPQEPGQKPQVLNAR